MNRRALIIGSPDSKIPGAKKDIENYKKFFLSPLGGLWRQAEIVALESPTKSQVTSQINALKSADYSVVVFAGHGGHVSASTPPIVVLQPNVEISSSELRIGAPKHTLILDCCRKLEPQMIVDSALDKAVLRKHALNEEECRKYFDKAINDSGNGLVVLYGCGLNETAGESSQGGWYSTSLIAAAVNWEADSNVDTSKNYDTLSVIDSHDRSVPKVRSLSGNRQNPAREQPRATKYFPFAVIA
jgi:Caspase domain